MDEIYTIIATNPYGTTKKTLYININPKTNEEYCISIGKTSLSVYVNTTAYPYRMGYKIYDKNGELIDYKTGDDWNTYYIYKFNYCFEPDEYIFHGLNTDIVGWSYGYMDIIVNGVKVNRFSYEAGDGSKNATINCI